MHVSIHVLLHTEEGMNLFMSNFSACQDYSVQIIHGICGQVRITNSTFLNLGKRFTSNAEQNSNITTNFAIIPVQVI